MLTRVLLSLALATGLLPAPARACETALILAIDVSNSIDSGEYRIQAEGMADALLDPLVMEALVRGAASRSWWCSGRGSETRSSRCPGGA